MAKDKLTDYDSTASGNLDVGGISVAEGMLPSGVNNAIRELMSHQADAFGAGTPLYVDQTNNRLGINQAAPAHPLHVGTDDLIVDASGNLLVGTTDIDTQNNNAGSGADNGFVYNKGSGGYFNVARYSGTVAYLNRTGTAGTIVDFRKDGSTVGSIAARSNIALTVNSQSGNGNLAYGGTNYVEWNNTRLGVATDNTIDLGRAAGRWKDLYLSGGVYLGGTGSANYLDDYEEGTWTPVISAGSGSFTSTTGSGRYTKIGNTVHCWGYSQITNVGSGTTVGGFAGLPFASINDSFPAGNRAGLGIVREDNRTGILGHMFIQAGQPYGNIQSVSGGNMLTPSTNDTFLFEVTYKTLA